LPVPALDEVVENSAPSLAGFAAHVLDGQQHLLAVLAHAENDQEHDRGGLPIEPDPHHSAVEDQPTDRFFGQRAGIPDVPIALHLAPHPAHRVLADRAAEQADNARCTRAVLQLRDMAIFEWSKGQSAAD
jgi:hypothetical protein